MKRLFLPALIAMLAMAPNVWAGTVYVPLMIDQDVDGTLIQTEVTLTNNSSTSLQGFTYLFLPELTDGTDRPDDAGTEILLQPQSTFILDDLIAPGAMGMLEITAGDEVSISARLVSTATNGVRNLGTEMPLVSSDSLIAAGNDGYIQGWSRVADQVRTDFGLINLGGSTMTCQAFVYADNGTTLVNGFEVMQPPLSQRSIDDVLSLIGLTSVENVSSRFNCNQPFYPYARVIGLAQGTNPGQTRFMGPSASGRSLFVPPGQVEPPPPGSTVFERPGVFHIPRAGNEAEHFDIPMPGNPVFSRIELDMDFTHGGWQTPSSFNHAIVWLNRGTRWRSNVFGYINAFGPGSNFVKLLTNVDLPAGAVQTKQQGIVLVPGQTYHLSYVYDTNANRITVDISQNGQSLMTFTDVPTVNNIRTTENNWFVVFGHEIGAVGPELPTYGWEYANLRVVWIP